MVVLLDAGVALAGGIVGLAIVGFWRRVAARRQPAAARSGFGRLRAAQVDIGTADLIYVVAMVVGIVAKALWDGLTSNSHTANIASWQLLAALIASPIVYSSVQQRLLRDVVSLPGLALAFQNGFFWQALFQSAAAASGH